MQSNSSTLAAVALLWLADREKKTTAVDLSYFTCSLPITLPYHLKHTNG